MELDRLFTKKVRDHMSLNQFTQCCSQSVLEALLARANCYIFWNFANWLLNTTI